MRQASASEIGGFAYFCRRRWIFVQWSDNENEISKTPFLPRAITSAGPAEWTFLIRKQASATTASQQRNGGAHSKNSRSARACSASFFDNTATIGPVSSKTPAGFTRRNRRDASCWWQR